MTLLSPFLRTDKMIFEFSLLYLIAFEMFGFKGISGSLVEGRICYDAFVLENKAKAIYYQANKAEE
jgi:hypothetical protein